MISPETRLLAYDRLSRILAVDGLGSVVLNTYTPDVHETIEDDCKTLAIAYVELVNSLTIPPDMAERRAESSKKIATELAAILADLFPGADPSTIQVIR